MTERGSDVPGFGSPEADQPLRRGSKPKFVPPYAESDSN